MPLNQTFQFQVGRFAVKEHHFDVHILAILMQEIFQEMADGFVRDMATDHDMPSFWEVFESNFKV